MEKMNTECQRDKRKEAFTEKEKQQHQTSKWDRHWQARWGYRVDEENARCFEEEVNRGKCVEGLEPQ